MIGWSLGPARPPTPCTEGLGDAVELAAEAEGETAQERARVEGAVTRWLRSWLVAMVAAADCIDDADVLRTGATTQLLGQAEEFAAGTVRAGAVAEVDHLLGEGLDAEGLDAEPLGQGGGQDRADIGHGVGVVEGHDQRGGTVRRRQ